MIEQISLDYLKIFYQVAKLENITKAAEKLYISQPAITQTINKLEYKLGTKLLIRTKRGVKLTDVGKRIFDKINNALLEINQIDEILDADNNLLTGKIVIGCGTNVAKKVLTNPIKKFLSKHPDVKFQQVDNTQDKMLSMLELGDMDLCITQKTDTAPQNLTFNKIFNDKFIFVCSPLYLTKFQEPIYIIQSDGSHNRQVFDEFAQGQTQTSTLQIVGYNLAIDLALNSTGVALAPSYLVQDFLKAGSLIEVNKDFITENSDYGYYINTNNISKAVAEFVKLLK